MSHLRNHEDSINEDLINFVIILQSAVSGSLYIYIPSDDSLMTRES